MWIGFATVTLGAAVANPGCFSGEIGVLTLGYVTLDARAYRTAHFTSTVCETVVPLHVKVITASFVLVALNVTAIVSVFTPLGHVTWVLPVICVGSIFTSLIDELIVGGGGTVSTAGVAVVAMLIIP
jgi:hypothetical protein